jgi:hypothetical protein
MANDYDLIQIQADLTATQNRIEELGSAAASLKTAITDGFGLNIDKVENGPSCEATFTLVMRDGGWGCCLDLAPEDVSLFVEVFKGVIARARRSQIEFYDKRHADFVRCCDSE